MDVSPTDDTPKLTISLTEDIATYENEDGVVMTGPMVIFKVGG